MEHSATPLLVIMILSIVLLALGVHGVSAADPFYGSQLDLQLGAGVPSS